MAIVQADITTQITPLGVAFQKAREQPNYGYEMKELPLWLNKTNGLPNILNEVNTFNANGGYPIAWMRPAVSVNRNLFTDTEVFTTKSVTLKNGFYQFWFKNGTGTITSSNGTGTATNHGAVTAGVANSRVINVTGAGTITFTVSGTVEKASLHHSQNSGLLTESLVYQKRDAVNVVPFNLGSGTETPSFHGSTGNNTNIIQTGVENNNFVFSNTGVLSNAVSAGGTVLANTSNFTMMVFIKPSIAMGENVGAIGSINTAPALGAGGVLGAGRAVRLIRVADTVVDTLDSTDTTRVIVSGAWQQIAVTYLVSSGTTTFYYNGVNVGSGTFPTTFGNGGIIWGARRLSGYAGGFSGGYGEPAVFNTALTDNQILNIFNYQKGHFGL